MQLIEDLPFGLAICAANGETATLTGLSDRQMRLRTHGAEPLFLSAVFSARNVPKRTRAQSSGFERTILCS